MNLNQLPACLICAALGASFVKIIDRVQPDDTVTAKRVVVTDDDGKTVIQMDASGLQVMTEDSDSYTRIKGQDKAQLEFVRDGSTVVSVGQNSVGTDGLTLYHGGKIAGAMSVNDNRAVLGLFSPNPDGAGPSNWDDLMSGAKGYVMMGARTNLSEVRVHFGEEEKSMIVQGD